MHSTHHYDVCFGLGGFARQSEAVADEVGDFLQWFVGVVVSKNNSVFLFADFSYFAFQINVGGSGLVYIAFFFPTFFYHDELCLRF